VGRAGGRGWNGGNTATAHTLTLPISSAIGAYSAFVRPLTSGRKRFHRPAFLALALRSSMTAGTVVHRSGAP